MPGPKKRTIRSGAGARKGGAGAIPARRKPGPKQPDGLTLQEIEFCKHYLSNGGNASEAARSAGYSPRSAGRVGSNLLGREPIAEFLGKMRAELERKAWDEAMLTVDGVRRYWLAFIRGEEDPGALPADRLRASGFLAKSLGAFVEKVEGRVEVIVTYSDEAEKLGNG